MYFVGVSSRFNNLSMPTTKYVCVLSVTSCRKCVRCMKWRLVRSETGLSPPEKYFTDRSKAVLLLWIFCVFFCFVFAVPLCASVYL